MNNKGLVARRKPNSPIPEISGLGTGNHIVLGVSVILNHVPVWLGVAHQAGAALLVAAMVWAAHWSRRGPA